MIQSLSKFIGAGILLLSSSALRSWSDTPSPAPRHFAVTPGDAQVSLQWDAVPGAIGYRVLRSTTAIGGTPSVVLSNLVATSITFTNIVNGSALFFAVSADGNLRDNKETARLSATPSSPVLDWLPAGAKVERLAKGFVLGEGPVWVPIDGGSLVFCDADANRMYRWRPGGTIELLRENTGGADGNVLDREGRLITCEYTRRRVSRTEADGTVVTLVDSYNGKTFNAPNDVAVKSDGTIWFTDPPFASSLEQPAPYVFRFDPAAGNPSVVTVLTNFLAPNGICFSPDEKHLYVADTFRSHIRAFDVLADNSLTNDRIFTAIQSGSVDGMHIDPVGRLWAAAGQGVQIFDPNGTLLAKIPMPEIPSNLCFGGTNKEMLFITTASALYGITRSPDLIVTGIQGIPATPAAGQAVKFSAIVKNQGTGPTPPNLAIRVALSVGMLTNLLWADDYAKPIPPGGSVVLECDQGTSGGIWIATPGTHTLRAVVDDLHRFSESNLSNNTFTAGLVVPALPPDTDGDGLSDPDEVIAGTDPQSAASVLRVSAVYLSSDGGLILSWESVAAMTYQIGYKNRLNDPAWTDLTDLIPSQGATTIWTNRPTTSNSGFCASAR